MKSTNVRRRRPLRAVYVNGRSENATSYRRRRIEWDYQIIALETIQQRRTFTNIAEYSRMRRVHTPKLGVSEPTTSVLPIVCPNTGDIKPELISYVPRRTCCNI